MSTPYTPLQLPVSPFMTYSRCSQLRSSVGQLRRVPLRQRVVINQAGGQTLPCLRSVNSRYGYGCMHQAACGCLWHVCLLVCLAHVNINWSDMRRVYWPRPQTALGGSRRRLRNCSTLGQVAQLVQVACQSCWAASNDLATLNSTHFSLLNYLSYFRPLRTLVN